ncbi:MAG: hypothetical protein IAF38_00555 [Bacteroidia bacterium]|nr:hypothetical protein [Bacteroidia bacterium]
MSSISSLKPENAFLSTNRRSKLILPLILSFMLLIFISFKVFRSNNGPHGGIVKVAGKYKIEMKNESSSLTEPKTYFYLLDKNSKSIENSKLTCRVKFFFNDSTSVDGQIVPYEKEGFVNLSAILRFNSCRVAFDLAGETISTIFENETILVKEE